MRRFILKSIVLVFFSSVLEAQIQDSIDMGFDEFFKSRIAKYEGIPAPLFKAPDLEGNVHYLDYYIDHIVILHFWQVFNDGDVLQIQSLNKIVEEYFDKGVVVIGFALNDIEDITGLLKTQEINYPVIPNSGDFAREYYGSDLGIPRVFLIDKYGIIQKVTTGGSYLDALDLYKRLKPAIEEHLKF